MSIIKRMRRQKAIWWARGAADRWGNATYAAPVEIDCRWDDKGELFRDRNNQETVSNGVVYPDRILTVGDKLKKGEMESTTPESPADDRLAFEIRRFDQTPNLRATETLFTAYL